MKIGWLILAFFVSGCVTIPERNPAKLPLHLNTFKASNNGIFTDRPDLDYKFNAYSKECGIAIYQSADKLAELFASTLDKNSPDYLYLQQSGFLYEYNQCMTLAKDNIRVRTVDFKKYMAARNGSAANEKKSASKTGEQTDKAQQKPDNQKTGTANSADASSAMKNIPKRRAFPVNRDFQNSYNNLAAAKPKTPEDIAAIILDCYLMKDYNSANAWQNELSEVLTREDNISPELYVARYFFRHKETRDIGYKMLEDYAAYGSVRALEILDTASGIKYRNEHPMCQKKYQKIVEMHTRDDE